MFLFMVSFNFLHAGCLDPLVFNKVERWCCYVADERLKESGISIIIDLSKNSGTSEREVSNILHNLCTSNLIKVCVKKMTPTLMEVHIVFNRLRSHKNLFEDLLKIFRAIYAVSRTAYICVYLSSIHKYNWGLLKSFKFEPIDRSIFNNPSREYRLRFTDSGQMLVKISSNVNTLNDALFETLFVSNINIAFERLSTVHEYTGDMCVPLFYLDNTNFKELRNIASSIFGLSIANQPVIADRLRVMLFENSSNTLPLAGLMFLDNKSFGAGSVQNVDLQLCDIKRILGSMEAVDISRKVYKIIDVNASSSAKTFAKDRTIPDVQGIYIPFMSFYKVSPDNRNFAFGTRSNNGAESVILVNYKNIYDDILDKKLIEMVFNSASMREIVLFQFIAGGTFRVELHKNYMKVRIASKHNSHFDVLLSVLSKFRSKDFTGLDIEEYLYRIGVSDGNYNIISRASLNFMKLDLFDFGMSVFTKCSGHIDVEYFDEILRVIDISSTDRYSQLKFYYLSSRYLLDFIK